MYLAYVGAPSGTPLPTGLNADSTAIFFKYSADGGATWTSNGSGNVGPDRSVFDYGSNGFKLNDDFSGDAFSEGNRPHFLPSIAVDQATGTVAVSWYDGRYDAARDRVVYMVTTSSDGGQSFAPDT